VRAFPQLLGLSKSAAMMEGAARNRAFSIDRKVLGDSRKYSYELRLSGHVMNHEATKTQSIKPTQAAM
jgi:hypothetical protein